MYTATADKAHSRCRTRSQPAAHLPAVVVRRAGSCVVHEGECAASGSVCSSLRPLLKRLQSNNATYASAIQCGVHAHTLQHVLLDLTSRLRGPLSCRCIAAHHMHHTICKTGHYKADRACALIDDTQIHTDSHAATLRHSFWWSGDTQ
jgi:hypothetical protein